MQINDLFLKPLSRSINGVVKADQDDNATVLQELDEYVVTNELEKHFRAFFESYSTELSDPSIANRVGVWISGFFGSGKSHFLKTLSYILANRPVQDAAGAQRLAVSFFDEHKITDNFIRSDIDKAVSNSADVMLFNIDSKASSNDDGNPILNVFLRVFNEHLGFSGDHPHIAHMERHLTERGSYEAFKTAFQEVAGSSWLEERDAYQFHQDAIEAAISSALGLSAEAAHKWFEDSEATFSVSVESFCHWVREYLKSQAPKHRVLFLVDEVGQFIGADTKLMLTLQTITENLGTICGGRAWIIVTSQADMDAVLGELSASRANDFSKIAGRFKTRLSLSSSNTDEVIQRRLLHKTATATAELEKVFAEKGDILKNQISFDRSGPTLKNFDTPNSFVANYPFAPYHFQLVQKVFEEIRKVGASGAHLAYGERSMLDAFQMAARQVGNQPIGTLVPLYRFYAAVEGFLDTAVKRTIDNAEQNPTLEAFDVQLLRTLFMIRYVDLVKGTLDNLVTLSIDQIDADKLSLRQQMEASLARLEKESLISRNGDEYSFLTNEEREITQKIKAIDIASGEENKELANLIYRDLLGDLNRFRYASNKRDYSVGRFTDSHSLDGRVEHDLRFEVISPLDGDYEQLSQSRCIARSTEGNGCILIKLPDNKDFFRELRSSLRTTKFIRLNSDDSQREIARILADRGRENQERRKRLRSMLEEMLLSAEVWALGQQLSVSQSSPQARFNEACEYLLENTYSKLSYLKLYQDEPLRELKAVLTVDDIGQLGLGIEGGEANAEAFKELEQYIVLRSGGSERTLVSDLIQQYSRRPYGWPDGEILLLIGRLAAAGRITLQHGTSILALVDAFEPLSNSRTRREISVIRKRQTDQTELKRARELCRQLFSKLGPESEKDLFQFYQQEFNQWLDKLKRYQSKTELGQFPGKVEIDRSVLALTRVLDIKDSYEFFNAVVGKKDDWLDLEEDYRDLHDFYENQIGTWQKMQQALRQYQPNQSALAKDPQAHAAMEQLQQVQQNPAPYHLLRTVDGAIATIETVNNQLLKDKRQQAHQRLDARLGQLQTEIDNSGIGSNEMSNKLMRPLQLLKQQIDSEASISQILMLQTQTAQEKLDDSLADLHKAQEQAAADQARAAAEAETARRKAEEQTAAGDKSATTTNPPPPAKPVKPVAAPKPVERIQASNLQTTTMPSLYLETQADIDQYLTVLRSQLENAVKNGRRVLIE